MQASIGWTPPSGTLGTLIEAAGARARELRERQGALEKAAESAPARPSLAAALRVGNSVGVIAEIKRRSPSKGAISLGLDAAAQARAYAEGGAVAISVLTEPSQFGGSLDDLVAARAAGIPLLRKDFIVDRLQLLEAVVAGASAVLLIARALSPDRLGELHANATALGLDALVEVRTISELEDAIAANYSVIGVNNRNLETLVIDVAVGQELIAMVPTSRVAVYESGVRTRDDVERAASAGADVVLVGSALSASGDPTASVRELSRVPRRRRRVS